MAAGPDRSAPAAASTVPLQHWVFGSSPEVGYGIKAKSPDLNLSMYDRRLDGIYAPLTGATLHGETGPLDVLMTHSANSATELLFSLITPGPDDSFGRKTYINHTAVLPLEPLQKGRLWFADVESAIRRFDASHAEDLGPVDPLTVAVHDELEAQDRVGAGIGRYLSRASAETLLTRMASDADARTLVLCRDSSPAERRATLLKIIEALNLACKIPIVSGLSDIPTGSAQARFQLVISARAFRADSTWALLDNALETPSLPRLEDPQGRYAALDRCYQAKVEPS
ncbi:MAG TPA: hypothetical protein VEK13_05310 [Thermoplasmata archaeon]|nr:hypothetical protein [Thermoplasmata archaeon]